MDAPLQCAGRHPFLYVTPLQSCASFESELLLSKSLFQTYTGSYRKIYFRINNTANTYIRGLTFFSFALPVIRLMTT